MHPLVGDLRVTEREKRIMVALEVFPRKDGTYGQVRFVFHDDPLDIHYQRRMSVKKWTTFPTPW